MGVDLFDDVVFFDTGDDSDRPAAGREVLGIDAEYSLEALLPDHRYGAYPGVRDWAGVGRLVMRLGCPLVAGNDRSLIHA